MNKLLKKLLIAALSVCMIAALGSFAACESVTTVVCDTEVTLSAENTSATFTVNVAAGESVSYGISAEETKNCLVQFSKFDFTAEVGAETYGYSFFTEVAPAKTAITFTAGETDVVNSTISFSFVDAVVAGENEVEVTDFENGNTFYYISNIDGVVEFMPSEESEYNLNAIIAGDTWEERKNAIGNGYWFAVEKGEIIEIVAFGSEENAIHSFSISEIESYNYEGENLSIDVAANGYSYIYFMNKNPMNAFFANLSLTNANCVVFAGYDMYTPDENGKIEISLQLNAGSDFYGFDCWFVVENTSDVAIEELEIIVDPIVFSETITIGENHKILADTQIIWIPEETVTLSFACDDIMFYNMQFSFFDPDTYENVYIVEMGGEVAEGTFTFEAGKEYVFSYGGYYGPEIFNFTVTEVNE